MSIKEYLKSSPLHIRFAMELAPSSDMLRQIREEILRLPESLYRRQVGGVHLGWDQLVIRGISPDHNGHFTRYGYSSADEVSWFWLAEACDFVPSLVNYVNDKFDHLKLHRIAIHRLGAGGEIRPHIDDLQGIFSAYLLAVYWPQGCSLKIEDQVIEINSGDVVHLNYMKVHSVLNRSAECRYTVSIMGEPKNYKKFYDFFCSNGDLLTPR